MSWPDASLNEIKTREDLALYLIELGERVRSGELRAENSATAAFVDSAGRWTKSMDGFFNNIIKEPVPESPDWAMIAAIFRAALVYE